MPRKRGEPANCVPWLQPVDAQFCGNYFDPHFPPTPPNNKLPVSWSKPLRYAYQKESRFVAEIFQPPLSTLPLL